MGLVEEHYAVPILPVGEQSGILRMLCVYLKGYKNGQNQSFMDN
jgi:hypothetical protein